MKAMIFAAGLGTRFKPWTDQHPKALAVVNGKSLLQRNVEYLQQYGITDLIVNVHHFAGQVAESVHHNKGWGSSITLSDEAGLLLETGGGLQKASWFFDDGPFAVINADILTDLDLGAMIANHHAHRPLCTLAVTNRISSRYFLFTDDGFLRGWKNSTTGETKGTSAPSPGSALVQKAFSGIHIIDPLLFSLISQTGKFSIVDTYIQLCPTHPILAFDHSHSKLVDVGRPESVAVAAALFP